jgi:hypothetical protein
MSGLSGLASEAHRLDQMLRERGIPEKKEWWERYLKNVIGFYGVPMGDIRQAIKEWKKMIGAKIF